QAHHNYEITDTFEAGMVLSGPEVKSIKKGQMDLKGAYASVDANSEVWLVNAYIASYKPARLAQKNYNPNQPRKLLLTKKEIRFLIGKQKEKGFSIIPLEVYLKNSFIKIKIGIGRGKKKYDKREALKKRDFERKKQRLVAI
ncbi:SsrA-binding protein, partial [Candidatus Kuenenbacteria bacterium CG23_combo_of_CG06-09_8_20_14_all_36_9]